LCASSPILDGNYTGSLDSRLNFYRTNQQRIPSITGKVIPEAVFSKRHYFTTVYDRIKADIAPFNQEGVLDPIWVNSRGAIPRFDRGSIEIRLMDIQESPRADLAIQTLVIETIKALTEEKFVPLTELMQQPTDTLAVLLDETTRRGHFAEVRSAAYLSIFGLPKPATAGEVWRHIHEKLNSPGLKPWNQEINTILTAGTLAHRIMQSLSGDFSRAALITCYKSLARCLAENSLFIP